MIAFGLWRYDKRRGQAVRGDDLAPAVDGALRRLLAGETTFVVLSISAPAYVQFATEPNGVVLAEANCPADNQAAINVLLAAGLKAVPGTPNYRAEFASRDISQLTGLVRNYLDAFGARSVTIRTGHP